MFGITWAIVWTFVTAPRSRRDLLLENLALRQQLSAFKARGKRPRIGDGDGSGGDAPSRAGLDGPVALSMAPTRDIISAINLSAWLRGLSRRDLELVRMRALGHTYVEIAHQLSLGVSTVCRRCRELGKALARHAELEVPEEGWAKAA